MTKKDLLNRIKSIEEHLGIVYVAQDNKDDYPRHISECSWSLENRVKKLEDTTIKTEKK